MKLFLSGIGTGTVSISKSDKGGCMKSFINTGKVTIKE